VKRSSIPERRDEYEVEVARRIVVGAAQQVQVLKIGQVIVGDAAWIGRAARATAARGLQGCGLGSIAAWPAVLGCGGMLSESVQAVIENNNSVSRPD
jgi:hypothetical protein